MIPFSAALPTTPVAHCTTLYFFVTKLPFFRFSLRFGA
jgi:hypothetical protein